MARMSWVRFVVLVILTHGTPINAQLDDPPRLLKRDPLTAEEENRREAQTLYGLGLLDERSDHLLKAVKAYEKALTLDPSACEPRRSLLAVYRILGRDADVLQQCREIVRLDPDDYRTWRMLSVELRAKDQHAEAVAALREGLRSSRLGDDPIFRLEMLSEVPVACERAGDNRAAAEAFRELSRGIESHKEALIAAGQLRREELAERAAEAQEQFGKLSLKRGEHGDAIEAFLAARKLHPDPERAIRVNKNLAEVFRARDEHLQALRFLELYLESEPTELEPYRWRADSLTKLGQPNRAINALRQHVAQMPDHVGLRLLLAEYLTEQLDFAARREAERIYKSTLEDHPSVEGYLGLFRLLQRERRVGEILNQIDTSWPKEDAGAGDRREAAQKSRAMITALKQDREVVTDLLTMASNDARVGRSHPYETWRMLGHLANTTRQLKVAEELFRVALRGSRRGSEGEIYIALFSVLWDQHQPEAVLELANTGLSRPRWSSNLLTLYYHKALALTELERYDEALAETDRAIRVAGDGADLTIRCQRVRILSRAGRHDEAIRAGQQMLDQYREPAQRRDIRYVLAHAYSARRDHVEAERELLLILDIDPNDATAHNDLGYQWAERGVNLEQAEHHVRRAIELDRIRRRTSTDANSDHAAYLDSLGWVLFRRGQLDEAKRWLLKASELPEGRVDPVVWDHLGDVQYRLSEQREARRSWRKALELMHAGRRPDLDQRTAELQEKLQQVGTNPQR